MTEIEVAAWQLNNEFAPNSIAALIMGVNPHEVTGGQIEPILQRMQHDYKSAIFVHMQNINETYDGSYGPLDMKRLLEASLQSKAMIRNVEISGCNPTYNHHDLYSWLSGDSKDPGEWNRSNFNEQTFSRNEIVRWLKINEISSVFPFDPDEKSLAVVDSEQSSNFGRTPHRTSLMDAVEEASARFWGVNVRADDNSTHTSNPAVVEWLVTKKEVEKTMAKRIATIIRPNWARKGRPLKD